MNKRGLAADRLPDLYQELTKAGWDVAKCGTGAGRAPGSLKETSGLHVVLRFR